jgi:hypothetical protein
VFVSLLVPIGDNLAATMLRTRDETVIVLSCLRHRNVTSPA